VGPSYVVVSAIVVALAFGSWPARVAAAADLAVLVFGGHIFAGLTSLDVAAVGHVTALAVAAVLLIWVRRARDGKPRGTRGAGEPGRSGQERPAGQPS
jgi:membrane associated rhomboid family serine protease